MEKGYTLQSMLATLFRIPTQNQIRKDGYKYIYIIFSLVLTGEYTKGASDMQVPPPKSSSNKAILYDSLVDNVFSPKIFVAVKDIQAYPQYLVLCKQSFDV